MRTISTNLKNALKTGKIASLIKITLKNGTVYAYTDHDVKLTVSGTTYNPAPGLQKIKQYQTVKGDTSNQTLQSGWVDAPASDLLAGTFDEATIEVAWCSWGDVSQGKVVTFSGNLGQITWDADGFHADAYSLVKRLDKRLNLVFMPTCRHKLYGTAEVGSVGYCGVNPTTFTATGSITSIPVQKWQFGISTSAADGYYTGATITFTSGNNSGLSFEVKNHASGIIELYLPTAFQVSVGNTYSIKAGCDKTAATCKAKFNNLNNFGGFPHIQSQVNFR